MSDPYHVLTSACACDAPAEELRDMFKQHRQHEPQLALAFCSPKCDLEQVAEQLRGSFTCPVIGCTTAGEIIPQQGYIEHSLALLSLRSPDIEVRQYTVHDLHAFSLDDGKNLRGQILKGFGLEILDPCTMFALLIIDGLSGAEERLSSLLAWTLSPMKIVGGSTGDDLWYQNTAVYSQGRFSKGIATLTVFRTRRSFRLFRVHHFQPTETKLVITEADPLTRQICEINGYPAVEEYARLIGCSVKDLESRDQYVLHPLLIRIGGEYFVRSIFEIKGNNTLQLACALDPGTVLTLGKSGDIVGITEQVFRDARESLGSCHLIIGFDCVQRRLEIQEKNLMQPMNQLMQEYHFFGFSSYGEQYQGLHINHTSTGVMLG
ncbi:FIST N-terminal domain-containing protein [Desulfogranum japonicum]|uniref:FIST N-terminal domain-containing protein n=1 Tax=Desulfogranum japonicum TaxID=231447 RepID=UPI00041FCE81|nr:FIST N-terminal domain-containing protein [Desulfogranum japonicum]